MELSNSYATGRRKTAVAKVWIKPGKGKIVINGKDFKDYLGRFTLFEVIKAPLVLTETQDKYDIECVVSGGGVSAQASAVKHGLSKVLAVATGMRSTLKKAGLLTRDSRMVEPKKYGLRKARKRAPYNRR